MLDKRLLVTCASLVMVMSVAVAAAMFPGGRTEVPGADTRAASDITRTRSLAPPPQPPQELEHLYTIKEHQGRVAVFSAADPDNPVMILNTLVRHLPAYDRLQLQEGIRVYTYQELEARIEDYTT